MREIGGYIEFETYYGSIYHDKAIALNCGRNALAYLIKSKHIKKIYLPYFCCEVVYQTCEKNDCEYEFYHINDLFKPVFDMTLFENEYLYIVNLYGQITNKQIRRYKKKYSRIIIDNAHSYFQKPVKNIDTLYTCRKYFGVSDGAFLYTDKLLDEKLTIDESFTRINYILGRFEKNASFFYEESKRNNEFFTNEKLKIMSKLTYNILKSINYKKVINIRNKNFNILYNNFCRINKIKLLKSIGPYMYPLYIENGDQIRMKLLEKKIYVPTLWPNVLDTCSENSLEYKLAKNILPLPIDQRYNENDMRLLINDILDIIKKENA